MSTRVHYEQQSSASVSAVFDTLTSPSWVQCQADRFHDGSTVLRHENHSDGGTTLVVSRELPAGVPGFLERFLPKDGRVSETFVWGAEHEGVRNGTWSVEFPGAPATLGGIMRLEPTVTGSSYVLDGEVKVKVPLIGGKAEKFIAGQVEKLAAKQGELLLANLP